LQRIIAVILISRLSNIEADEHYPEAERGEQ
jgi:hypothetical protein